MDVSDRFAVINNPWADDDPSLQCLRDALSLAENMGVARQVKVEEKVNIIDRCREKYSSMMVMDLLEQRDSCRKNNYEVNLNIQKILLDKETKDVTHLDILERRNAMLNELNNHLQEITSQNELLKSRLQRPYVGEFLKIDASAKSKMVEMFQQIAPLLCELNRNLEDITWAGKMPFSDMLLSQILDDLSAILATLQTGQRSLEKMREVVDELHHIRTPDVSRCEDRQSVKIN